MLKLSKYKLVGLDTNIFVYYLQKHPQFGPTVKQLFQSLSHTKTEGITSSIILIELLSVQIPDTILDILKEELLLIPFLKIFSINNDIAIEAAQIRREYSFNIADAIQLATAKYAGADICITNDEKLKKFKELKVVLLSEI